MAYLLLISGALMVILPIAYLLRVWWKSRRAPPPFAINDAFDDDDDFLGVGS